MEELALQPMEILLSVITILLGIVGYFLRQIHSDFRAFKDGMVEFNLKLAVGDEREKAINDKIEVHDKRISELEKIKKAFV